MVADIGSRSLSGRVVLLCLADLETSGRTPAHTAETVRATRSHLESVEAETLGKLSEAEVNRALNRLEADGLVAMVDSDDRSPVGKGRPEYTLDVAASEVLESLADDPEVGTLARRVEDGT